MKKKIPTFIYPLITIALVGAISFGVTYAVFAATDKASQAVQHTKGQVKKSIFLDCAAQWNQGYGELIYAAFYNSSNPSKKLIVEPSREVTYTDMVIDSSAPVSKDLYVFEMDTVTYNRIIFTRMNPNLIPNESDKSRSSTSYCSQGDSTWWSTGADVLWGRTNEIQYNSLASGTNYFRIDDYHLGTKYYKYSYGTIESSGKTTIAGSNTSAPS